MPILDLPADINTVPVKRRMAVILPFAAVVFYPSNEKQRKNWMAALTAGFYGMPGRQRLPALKLSDLRDCMASLSELPLAPQRIVQDGFARRKRGKISGMLLLYLLALARHHPRHCTVERAKVLLVHEVEKVSESLVEKIWAEYQSVSHFWLSMMLKEDAGIVRLAETIRREAETRRILSPSIMWRAAKEFPPFEFDIEPLDPKDIAFLNDQFPET